jgi:Ni,Fe-hydrogenase maturation factor
VIFVDARAGEHPGRIDCQPVGARPDPGLGFSHHLAPAALLGLTQELYARSVPAWLISIDGADFGYGSELSPKVRAALPAVLARVRALVAAEPTRTGA